jgi:hypothetical protein
MAATENPSQMVKINIVINGYFVILMGFNGT